MLVRGARIAAVGTAREIHVPADAEVVDGRGKFVAPGFTDSHVHGSGPEEIDPRCFSPTLSQRRDINGQALLYEWRDQVEAGALFSPAPSSPAASWMGARLFRRVAGHG